MSMPTLPAQGNRTWYPWATAIDQGARANANATVTVHQYGGDTIARHRDGSIVAQASSGASNDADIINAALDATAATPGSGYRGGGTIHITAGEYLISEPIDHPYGTNIIGEGAGLDDKGSFGTWGTVLSAAPSYSGPIITAGVTAGGDNRLPANPHHGLVKGLAIDGRGNGGIGVRSHDTRLYRMREFVIRNCNVGHHNSSTLPPDEGGLAHEFMDFFIQGCPTGILVDGTGGTDGMIYNGRILSGNRQVRLIGGGGWQVHGLHLTHSAGNDEHMELVTNKTMITNCYFDSGRTLLKASATSWLVATGNLFQMTGTGNSFIEVGTKVNISGNSFEWSVNANPRSFVQVGAASAEGVFCNNWGGPTGGAWVAPVTTPGGSVVESNGNTRKVEGNAYYTN